MTNHTSHPFLRPLWRRILLVLFCFGWAGVEFYNDDQTWGLITLAIAAYAIWSFLISYPRQDSENGDLDKP
ncbi:hypothetical protein [Roseibium sp. RKSG952]|uniref:hypothetical protein n=1 Tax=Roseibium sp. RKSG952 TaxID=2529384 RepID=UPI0012BCDAA0|nr:hypothetical protein [Roseibium sp. RKSG952]MTH96493.1 hypothetical protein [Roseibium sp. RKSG952]